MKSTNGGTVSQHTTGAVTVAYVIFGLAMGGAEMVLLELVKGLDRSRFRPVVISLAPPAALSEAFAAHGVEVHHLGMVRIDQSPLTLLKAWRLVRRLKPAIVHGVMFYGDFTARLLKLTGATSRTVGAFHSTYIGAKWCETALRLTDGYADAVTAVSSAVAEAQIAAKSIRPEKITVIPNGIDLRRFDRPSPDVLTALRARFGLQENDRVLLAVGRLEREKNHALLLRVFARLRQTRENIRLLVLGGGSLDEPLQRQASDLGVASSVCFAGPVSDVGPTFHLAEWFVLSSSLEGLPLVVLEAMAASRSMVLTRVGGIPEVIEHDKTGILVPPDDDDLLFEALSEALDRDEASRDRLGAAARAHVEAHFSMQHMVTRHQALYEELLCRA